MFRKIFFDRNGNSYSDFYEIYGEAHFKETYVDTGLKPLRQFVLKGITILFTRLELRYFTNSKPIVFAASELPPMKTSNCPGSASNFKSEL